MSANDSPSPQRALVALQSSLREAYPQHPVRRTTAAFLAHLIASARQMPQTRVRRRADAGDVIAAYKATVEKLKALDQPSR